MEYMDYHKTEFRFEDWSDETHPPSMGMKSIEFDTISDNLVAYYKKYPLDYKKALKYIAKYHVDVDPNDPERRMFVTLIMSRLRQEKADSLLWRIIDDKIKGWWD